MAGDALSKAAVCELMRVSWYTVGRIIERVVVDERARQGDPLKTPADRDRRVLLSGRAALHHRRCCHDTGPLVWAEEGRDKETVARFFAELRPERSAGIELVSSDMGEWITRAVAERCPQATPCLDPFHVVALASDALDEVRREVWNEARRSGDSAGARWLKGARWALWKRPERLTERQQAKLATIEHVNHRLYRAYLLKRNSGSSSRASPKTPSLSSRPGSSGQDAAGSRASSSSPRQSPPTSKGSSRRSPTDSPTPESKRGVSPVRRTVVSISCLYFENGGDVMSGERSRYSPEFKDEAVRFVIESQADRAGRA